MLIIAEMRQSCQRERERERESHCVFCSIIAITRADDGTGRACCTRWSLSLSLFSSFARIIRSADCVSSLAVTLASSRRDVEPATERADDDRRCCLLFCFLSFSLGFRLVLFYKFLASVVLLRAIKGPRRERRRIGHLKLLSQVCLPEIFL